MTHGCCEEAVGLQGGDVSQGAHGVDEKARHGSFCCGLLSGTGVAEVEVLCQVRVEVGLEQLDAFVRTDYVTQLGLKW